MYRENIAGPHFSNKIARKFNLYRKRGGGARAELKMIEPRFTARHRFIRLRHREQIEIIARSSPPPPRRGGK